MAADTNTVVTVNDAMRHPVWRYYDDLVVYVKALPEAWECLFVVWYWVMKLCRVCCGRRMEEKAMWGEERGLYAQAPGYSEWNYFFSLDCYSRHLFYSNRAWVNPTVIIDHSTTRLFWNIWMSSTGFEIEASLIRWCKTLEYGERFAHCIEVLRSVKKPACE